MSAWGGVRVCGGDTTVCGVVWESVEWYQSVWGWCDSVWYASVWEV